MLDIYILDIDMLDIVMLDIDILDIDILGIRHVRCFSDGAAVCSQETLIDDGCSAMS